MKKSISLLLMLFMCVTGAWAIEAYDVGSDDLSSASRAAESTAFTLKGDGVITYTFTNYTNPDDDNYAYSWHLYCTNTSETKDDISSANRYFILHAQGSAEAYNDGTGSATLSDNYKCSSAFDFLTWNNEATGKITITRSGANIKVEAVFTKEGTEYTCTYSYNLSSAHAADETKFFLANGRHNYLHVTDESSQAFDYSTLYIRDAGAWTAADVTAWGASDVDNESLYRTGGNTSNAATYTISPQEHSIIGIEAQWIGASNTGRTFAQGNCSYFAFGNIWVMENDQDKAVAYSLTGNPKEYTTFTGDATWANRDFDVTAKNFMIIKMEVNTATNMLNYLRVYSSANPTTALLNVENKPIVYDYTKDVYKTITSGFYKGNSVSTTNYEWLKSIKVVETPQQVETADYTVQYLCGTEKVKDVDVRQGVVGNTVTLRDEDKADFFSEDGNTKYLYASDDAASQTVVSAGTTVVTVNFNKASKFAYTVKTSTGTVLTTGSDFQGATISYAYPRYVNNEGTLYSATRQTTGDYWGSSFKLTQDNQVVEIPYTATNIKDVVYFTETEDITGATEETLGNASARCSNMKAGVYSGKLTTLPAGNYRIGTSVWGNSGTTITFKAGENTILEAATMGSIADYTSNVFTLTTDADVYISGGSGGSSPKVSDFIYIIKAPEQYNYTVKSSIGTTIAEGTYDKDGTVSYGYPRYINNEGTLYSATQNSKDLYWGNSFTLDQNNKEVTVAYTATSITDVVYFSEVEDILGATTVTGSNASIRCSNMKGGLYTGTITKLPAGTYKLSTSVWGGTGETITFKAGDNAVLAATTKGYIVDYTSDPFTLKEETDITMSGGSGSKCADFVYIVKSQPVYSYTVKAFDGENELGTITSGSNEADKEIYWSKYQKFGDKWYEMPSTYMTVSATEAENEIKVAATASNITYFVEGEGMTMTHSAAGTPLTGNAYSGGSAPRHYLSSYWYTPETIPAGTYKMKASYKNNNASSTTLTINYLKDGTLSDALATVTGASGTGTLEATNIVIPEGGAAFVINNANTFNSNLYIDYMTLEPWDPCTWTVKTSLGETLASGSDNKGTTVSYAYPRYINNEGTLYQSEQNTATGAARWGNSFTLTENSQEVTVDYKATDITDVVFFAETEDIQGAVVQTGGNANIRCSNMKAGFYEGNLVTLPTGTYKLSTSIFGVTTDPATVITFKAGEQTILEAPTKGSVTDYTSEPFTLNVETAISMAGGSSSGSSPKVADFVYIYKYNPTAINNVDANASTSSAQTDGKYIKAGKLVIVKNGKLYNAAGQIMK